MVPRGSLPDGEPPYAAVLALDRGGHLSRHAMALVFALFAHSMLAAAVALQHVATARRPVAARHPEIHAELERVPPQPPPAPSRLPEARKPPRVAERTPQSERKATPPSPAQAGRVVTQAPEPSGPADLTDFDLVVGQGVTYAGGYSSASGTSRQAVEDVIPKNEGVADAPPPSPPPPSTPDLSRPALPLDRDWACAWPDEAQETDLRDARVTIRVTVDKDGSPSHVDVLGGTSGGGFAEAARHCAERERYRVALDTSGRPVTGTTNLFNVHFLR